MKKTVWIFISFLWMAYHVQAQIVEITAETSLDKTFQTGLLTVQVQLAKQPYTGQVLEYKLKDDQGEVVIHHSMPIPKQTDNLKFSPQNIHHPRLWNAEFPNCYTLEVSLLKKNGTSISSRKRTVLFRSIVLNEKDLLVNGQKVRIKGINLRNWKDLTDSLKLKKAITEWKQHHVNAVRIATNPQQAFFTELCNQYGLYVLNEAAGMNPTHPALREGCLWNWPNHDLAVKWVEMKKLYQDISFFDFNAQEGSISIQNLHSFTNLNQFDFYYIIRDHGKEVYRNTIEGVKAASGETFVYKGLKGIQLERNTTGDVRIEFYATNRNNKPHQPKGTVIASEQTYIHTFFRPAKPTLPQRTLLDKMTESTNKVIFSGQDLQLIFDKQSGKLVSYCYQGEEYLHQAQGMCPFFWRAPTYHDRIAHLPDILKPWKEASYQPTTAVSFRCITGKKPEIATIHVSYHYPQTDAQWDITYKVYTDGTLKINNRFVAKGTQTPMIPRVGLRMQLNPALTTFQYFGRGPRANYRDCRTAQFLGKYTTDIHHTHESSLYAQENSHRTDIYWCTLTGHLKGGLLWVADRTFETNVTHYLLEDIERGKLQPSNLVDFFIDFRMMGIGADNRPGTPVQEPFIIRPGEDNSIEYGFTLLPFKQGEDAQQYILKY